MKDLFEGQRKYINRFFDEIDLVEVQKILDLLLQSKGAFFFTGIGKSGHIAEKIAATFASMGSRAFFLNPSNALHGDVGCLMPEDLCLLFSKSGNSQELVDLVPYVKKKGAKTVAIVSSSSSKLAKMAHASILLPVEKEICPYNLAPTTSTVIQLIFGDCLAVGYMRAKGFSVNDFSSNHPGGVLGRKISLKVADLMIKGVEVPKCRPKDSLIDVLHELSKKRCGCLLVADDEDRLCGIFTDGDLRRAIELKGTEALSTPILELMTANPKNITQEKLAFEAVQKMEEDPSRLITVLPVLEEGRVVGLIRMHDILQKEFP